MQRPTVAFVVRTGHPISDVKVAELERAVGAKHVRKSPTPANRTGAGDDVLFHLPPDEVEAAECRAIRLCFVTRTVIGGMPAHGPPPCTTPPATDPKDHMAGDLQSNHGSVLVEGDFAVCLVWEGEGWGVGYRPDDPEDEPLLRAYALRRRSDGSWRPHLERGSSGLTRLSDRSTPDERQAALEQFMRTLRPLMAFRHVGFKAALRRLSKLTWDDISNGKHQEYDRDFN